MRGNVAGLAFVQIWRTDQYGRMAGTQTDPDNITANTTTSALLLKGSTGVDIADPERQRVVFQGNDGVDGSLYFGASDLPEGTFTTEVVDSDLFTMAMGGTAYTGYGNTVLGTNPMKKQPNTLGMCISSQYQDRESGSDGTNRWFNRIFKVQLIPRFAPATYQEKATFELQLTPVAQTRYPNGIPFGSNEGWQDNTTYDYSVMADYPLGFTTFVANGAATTFTTGYRPISTTITDGDFPNFFAVQNTQTALDSIVTTTGVATLAAAGTTGDFTSLIYETEFTEI